MNKADVSFRFAIFVYYIIFWRRNQIHLFHIRVILSHCDLVQADIRAPAGDLLASVKIFSEKISRSAAPCVTVAVDNAASIWRFCRIFRIIKLPECIRTVAYHSTPVIFHIFHCLVFFTTHQKCFHKMMVHIRRNHSFFRFQFHQTIQYFCSFFAADCFRQNNPYLTCS